MSYQSEVLADNPLLYLRFEETSGAACANSGSLGGNATANGTFTRNVAGYGSLGVGITLGASSGYVSYPDNSALDITGNVTFECWIKPSVSQSAELMSKGQDAGFGYDFQLRTTGIRILKIATTVMATSSAAVPIDGAWHHVAVTINGSSYAFYIDGVSAGSGTVTAATPDATAQPFVIGGSSGSGSVSPLYSGAIDEVAVYSTALSSGRVAAHYAAATAAPAPVADFTGTPVLGAAPLSVAFTDASTNTPTSWAWDFGDSGTSISQNPTHSYASAGTYTVTLIATNAGGSNTKTRTGYITVAAPIVGTDIKWPLSGGAANASPNAALGGAASSVEIVDATTDNLFDDVGALEAIGGDVEYRGFYVKNGHASLPLSNVKVYISGLTGSAGTEFDLGLAAEATNATMATIANENTAPAGVSFSRPTDYASGLSIGTLNAGDRKGVWIRRTVTAGVGSGSDSGIIKVEGTP